MKKVKVTADLELKSENGTISVFDNDETLTVTVSSSSAVTFPLANYLTFKKYIKLSKKLSQSINLVIDDLEVIRINDGKIYYLQKWWLFKFLLKSFFA